MDPVAGAWPESQEGSIQANAKRTEERRRHFIELVNTPGTLPYCRLFELTKNQDGCQPCRVTVSGVVWQEGRCGSPVIPAKAGIHPVDSGFELVTLVPLRRGLVGVSCISIS
jgi:hypothetical protein